MAATDTWPLELPQYVNRGFSSSVGANIIRTPMDAGPAKMRRRSKRAETLSVGFLMTTAQADILENFALNILQGVKRFNFNHPRKLVSTEVRMLPQQDGNLYNIAYRAPGYWDITMQLEILP